MGLNPVGVSGKVCRQSVSPVMGGLPNVSACSGLRVILYVLKSFESRTTTIGLGALPERCRLKRLLVAGAKGAAV